MAILPLLATATVLLASCGANKQSSTNAGDTGAKGGGATAPPAPMVTVASVEQRPVPVEIEGIGNVQPYRTVQLKSMVDGQISRVLLQQGDDVRAGQLLFQLDKRPFQAALDQAKGRLAQDEATAAYNRAQAERDKALASSGVIAPQVLQQQEAQAQANAAAVQADKATVQTARVNLGYTDIRAPIDARAGAILVNLGNLVKANDTNPLITLNEVMPIYVQFSVPEAQLPAVRGKGVGRLEIRAYRPNDPNPSVGKLTFIDNAVDATTGTIKLMGTFANRDRRLWPGEFVNVRLVLGMEPHATVVPATAVQTGQQGKYVLVVQPDNTAVMRPISSSRSYRQLAVIDNGLQPGERVIVEGQIRVVPNNKVQVVKTVPVEPAPEQLAQQSGTLDMSGGRP